MIKLIATDLDGTLLDDNKNLPPGFHETIISLKEHGVRMVIASGRQYFNIVKLFESLQDDLYFLGDNGCVVYDGRNRMGFTPINTPDLLKAWEKAKTIPSAHPVFCGLNAAYTESSDPFFLKNLKKFNDRCIVVPDLREVLNSDHICKLALFDAEFKSEINLLPVMQEFKNCFNIALAAPEWLDCMPPGMNKGVGLKLIVEKLGLSPQNVMAFGDYENDREMLEYCYHSYAMKNAYPDILKIARNVTEFTNNEAGVLQTIRKHFDFL